MRPAWMVAWCALAACTTVEPAPQQPQQPTDAGPRCAPGGSRACSCGAQAGSQTCVAPNGVWSGCGCTARVGNDVVVPPAPPPVSQCGGVARKPYPQEDSEVGAKGCCTASGACGSSSTFVLGNACVARGGPAGTASPACPSESVNFLDLEGCCRPDGACGLSLDLVSNFDLGCIERTEMERLVNAGSSSRDVLSLVFFLPIKAASFPAQRCVP